MPNISILVPVFNGKKYVKSTLDSVLAQTYRDWEVVVMDGGSTDGTLEIIQSYAARHPNIRVFSERDEGVWHAIYKSAQRASGRFLTFLCVSDGYVNKEWLEKVARKFAEDKDVSLVWGIPFQADEQGKILGPNYLYAQFIADFPDNKKLFLSQVFGKLKFSNWRQVPRLFSKLRPENLRLAKRILSGQSAVPEKEEWFFHWLKTGQFFPDLNMCLYKEVFLDCVPEYVLGKKVVDEYMPMFYNFNAKGYLSYGLPIPANYGRVHAGQYTERVEAESERMKKEYFGKIRDLRKKLVQQGEMFFYDHEHKLVSRREVVGP